MNGHYIFKGDGVFYSPFSKAERLQMQRERDQKLDAEVAEVEAEIQRVSQQYRAQSARLEAEDILAEYYQRFPYNK